MWPNTPPMQHDDDVGLVRIIFEHTNFVTTMFLKAKMVIIHRELYK
jgi:hypothetical protein